MYKNLKAAANYEWIDDIGDSYQLGIQDYQQ